MLPLRSALTEGKALFGVDDVEVRERWQGVYSSAPGTEFLLEMPLDRVHIVTVTTGIGMTTGLGLAESSLTRAFEGEHAVSDHDRVLG